MLLGITVNVRHPGVDENKVEDRVLAEIVSLIEKHAESMPGINIAVEPLGPGDDCADYVEVDLGFGCGNVADLVDVELSLDGREIMVDSVMIADHDIAQDAVEITVTVA